MPVESRQFAENRTLAYLAKTHALARRRINIDTRMAAYEKQHVEGLILMADHHFSCEEVLMMRQLAQSTKRFLMQTGKKWYTPEGLGQFVVHGQSRLSRIFAAGAYQIFGE